MRIFLRELHDTYEKPDAERTVKDDCRMSKKNTTPNLAVLNSKFHALKISDQTQLDIARLKRTDP